MLFTPLANAFVEILHFSEYGGPVAGFFAMIGAALGFFSGDEGDRAEGASYGAFGGGILGFLTGGTLLS